mgnify:CR=1 FL=1
MRSYSRNLFRKIGGLPLFVFIFLSISGCSEFHNSFSDEYTRSFVSKCMEKYDKNPIPNISRLDFLRYCDCTLDQVKDSKNRVQYSKLFPGKFDDILDYCYEAVINP